MKKPNPKAPLIEKDKQRIKIEEKRKKEQMA